MADFGDYPPNMAPQDALVVRQVQQAQPDHEIVKYSAEDLSRPMAGPANPFKSDETVSGNHALKRKNIMTGTATETFISESTFRSKHRAVERAGGPEREYQSGDAIKAENKKLRQEREGKGDSTIAEGEGSYVGPWARKKKQDFEVVEDEAELGSDEEYEIIYEDDDDDVVESGALVSAPKAALDNRREVEEAGEERTIFHGAEQYDYQGRTYMHVPQDLDIDLRKEPGSITNYIPKKLFHEFRDHKGDVTALEFLPNSGHLLLSAGADQTVKIWDMYHQRELLRTYKGHNKAISGISFNHDGTSFVSGSYDRMMKLWDTETGKCISKFTTGKTPHVVKFTPHHEHYNEFLAGMSDNKVIQYDVRKPPKEHVQTYEDHDGAINTITFYGDNSRFMTTSDDKILRAWDYGFPVAIRRIAEPDMYPLVRAAVHPNGKNVAYQSTDNQILVYGGTDKVRQNRKKSYRGHNNAGRAIDLDISPDGQFLASGDSSGRVCFWDWKRCKMFDGMTLKTGNNQAVTCLKWHPQETSKIATAGQDGIIRYWD